MDRCYHVAVRKLPPKCNVCSKQLSNWYAKVCIQHRKHRSRKGKAYTPIGYIRVYKPEHPYTGSNGYLFQHRLVMEETLGRYLLPNEKVHHINHIKDDNRPENLMLTNLVEHGRLHSTGRKQTEEAKQKVSKARMGNKVWLGKKHKQETLHKMSIARKLFWERRSNA